MNASVQEIKESAPPLLAHQPAAQTVNAATRPVMRLPTSILAAAPGATLVAMGVHNWASRQQPATETRTYFIFLGIVLGLSVLIAAVQPFWQPMRQWMARMCPIIAAALCLMAVWEVITCGLKLLPMPYFPGPAGVLQSMFNDRELLFSSTWHSLILLFSGYALGVAVALVTGVCIGWFSFARYWGMPLLSGIL